MATHTRHLSIPLQTLRPRCIISILAQRDLAITRKVSASSHHFRDPMHVCIPGTQALCSSHMDPAALRPPTSRRHFPVFHPDAFPVRAVTPRGHCCTGRVMPPQRSRMPSIPFGSCVWSQSDSYSPQLAIPTFILLFQLSSSSLTASIRPQRQSFTQGLGSIHRRAHMPSFRTGRSSRFM